MILEGWAAKINDAADHTYVHSPSNGQYFDCWGSHTGPDLRLICRGDGSYNWANCYRCPIWALRDTACIGVYAVDGVCHQSTNCFLYSAGVTLNFAVRGYWFSLFSYGTYGRSFLRWLALYGYCSSTQTRGIVQDGTGEGMDEESAGEDRVIEIVRDVHASSVARRSPRHPNDVIADETAKVTKHQVPEVEPDQFRDIQLRYLQQKDALIASGIKEEKLAERLNDLARRTQRDIAKRIGRERYERLMGVPAGEELNLTEPAGDPVAGDPVPSTEQMRENVERPGEEAEPGEEPPRR
jgi:hypothetical protein